MSDSFCLNCRNTGHALYVALWRGEEVQATKACPCPIGRETRFTYHAKADLKYLRESDYRDTRCVRCKRIHRLGGMCPVVQEAPRGPQ
jgi:hypothetical protein